MLGDVSEKNWPETMSLAVWMCVQHWLSDGSVQRKNSKIQLMLQNGSEGDIGLSISSNSPPLFSVYVILVKPRPCLNPERICDPRLVSQNIKFFQDQWLVQEWSYDPCQSNQSRSDWIQALLFELLAKQSLFFRNERERIWSRSYWRILSSWGDIMSKNKEKQRKAK